MKTRVWIVILTVGLLISGTVGYLAGRKAADAQLGRSVRSLAIAQSAKETAYYTRLLEGLHDGQTDLVTDRLETMLDHSVVTIGIETGFTRPPENVDEAVSRSLCLARNYRALHPHRPTDDWSAKQYDAALALITEHN